MTDIRNRIRVGANRVLVVVGRDTAVVNLLRELADAHHVGILVLSSADEVLDAAAARCALVVLDLDAAVATALEVMRRVRLQIPDCPVVALATSPDTPTALAAGAAGAADLLDKRGSADHLRRALAAVLEKVLGDVLVTASDPPPEADDRTHLFRLSAGMRELAKIVARISRSDAPVLIQGEPGVGKELVALAIHRLSRRADGPWVKVNCLSLPADLLEAELFGARRPAIRSRPARTGQLELARGGTLFLDEISELPGSVQARLQAATAAARHRRPAEEPFIRSGVRVLAATSADLRAMAAAGQFRKDLYEEVSALAVVVPPLRQRREEIPFLLAHFARESAAEVGGPVPEISPELIDLAMRYGWPGNVRELAHVVKRWVVLGHVADARSEIEARLSASRSLPATARPDRQDLLDLKEVGRQAAREAERVALLTVLDRTRWNRQEAAKRLGVSLKTLSQKIREAGLTPPRKSRGSEPGWRE
jgi:DNA-binding NtrC family response regulator